MCIRDSFSPEGCQVVRRGVQGLHQRQDGRFFVGVQPVIKIIAPQLARKSDTLAHDVKVAAGEQKSHAVNSQQGNTQHYPHIGAALLDLPLHLLHGRVKAGVHGLVELSPLLPVGHGIRCGHRCV